MIFFFFLYLREKSTVHCGVKHKEEEEEEEEAGVRGSSVAWRPFSVCYCLLHGGCLINMSDMLFSACCR